MKLYEWYEPQVSMGQRQLTNNKGNFSKQSVVQQQLSFSLNPNPNLIGKRQEARWKICDSCSCCVGQVAFLDNSLLSVK